MEPVCEAEQSLIAGHLQVKVHIIHEVGVEHCNTTSLVNRLVTRKLAGYQLVEVYQLEAGKMSW